MSNTPQIPKRSDMLRSEIDQTRQQMDQTIDALTDRLKGRHIIDEVIGVIRSNTSEEKVSEITEKVTSTANSAVNTVVNNVKANPLPLLLIGAGVAWMVYNSRRSNQSSDYLQGPYEDDLYYESGYEYSGGGFGASELSDYEAADYDAGGSKLGEKFDQAKSTLRDKAAQAKDQVQAKASEMTDRVKQSAQAARERVSQVGTQARERSREIYERSRERVTTTVNQHPVEIGLGVLALGVIAGLAIPTPRKVHEVVGPRVDRLRDRARQTGQDLMNKGRTVVEAAANAAKQEANSQGLTPDALRDKAKAVVQRTEDAVKDTARAEGLAGQADPLSVNAPAGQAS